MAELLGHGSRRRASANLPRPARPSAGRNGPAGSPCRPRRRCPGWSGTTRSMRVASLTLPFSTGTLRSTRHQHAFARTGRVVEGAEIAHGRLASTTDEPDVRPLRQAGLSPAIHAGRRLGRWHGCAGPSPGMTARPVRSASPSRRPCRPCGSRSPIRCRTRTDAHEGAVDHLGLVHVEGRRMRVVVEVDRDVGLVGDSRARP